MKNIRCLIMACALAFSLSAAAFAGDMQGVGGSQPDPPPPGDMQGVGAVQPQPYDAGVIELSIAETFLLEYLALVF